MKLIPGWKKTLLKAWSVRLALLAALLTGVQNLLPLFLDFLPQTLGVRLAFSVVTLVVIAGAVLARVVSQPRSFPDD